MSQSRDLPRDIVMPAASWHDECCVWSLCVFCVFFLGGASEEFDGIILMSLILVISYGLI